MDIIFINWFTALITPLLSIVNFTISANIKTLNSVIITEHNAPLIIVEKKPFSLIKKPHVLFTKQYAGNKNSILIFNYFSSVGCVSSLGSSTTGASSTFLEVFLVAGFSSAFTSFSTFAGAV